MRILAGLAMCVRTMKGSNVAVVVVLLMVLATALVPHQLFVAVTVPSMLLRLLPKAAVLPARRLNVMFNVPNPPLRLPTEIAPPLPVVVLPVIVTLESVTESGFFVFIKNPPPSFWFAMLPMPALLLLMIVPWSTSRLEEAQIPPPDPLALLLEMVLE